MGVIERICLPSTSPGTERFLTIHRFGSPSARPKAYIQAGLHAGEVPGILVAHHLVRLLEQLARNEHGCQPRSRGHQISSLQRGIHPEWLLDQAHIAGEVVVVPVANPIGSSQRLFGRRSGRFNIDTGINFNRGHPDLSDRVAAIVAGQLGDDGESNAVRIRAAIQTVIASLEADTEEAAMRRTLFAEAAGADLVFDLHCDYEALLHLYLPSSHWPEARDIPALLGSRVQLLSDESGGGPFDEACGRVWWSLARRFPHVPIPLACLGTTIELRGMQDVSDELAARDAQNLLELLRHRGVITGPPAPLPKLRRRATPLAAVDMVKATRPGIVLWQKQLGAVIAAGEPFGWIIDPNGSDSSARVPITSCTDGILFLSNG